MDLLEMKAANQLEKTGVIKKTISTWNCQS